MISVYSVHHSSFDYGIILAIVEIMYSMAVSNFELKLNHGRGISRIFVMRFPSLRNYRNTARPLVLYFLYTLSAVL